ncbi:hypothetical protein Hdeb2414_s0007g00252821 [Helianthus debilis subsp. tardiflorus]
MVKVEFVLRSQVRGFESKKKKKTRVLWQVGLEFSAHSLLDGEILNIQEMNMTW